MPVKNFFNHLKYLVKTSFAIINEFGIRYFFNFGIVQLKDQKLDLLKPHDDDFDNIEQEPKIERKEQYFLWKKNLTNIYSINQEQDFPTLNFSPQIHIFLMIDAKTSQKSIELSIDSIQNQNYPYWKLSIFTNNQQTFDFVSKSIESDSKSKISLNLIQNNEFQTLSSFHIIEEYVYFLTGQIKLEKTALYHFIKSLNKDSFDLVYSDEEKLDTKTNEIQPFFKPDWSSYLLLASNYIGNSFLVSKKILDKISSVKGLSDGDFFDLLHQSTELSDNIYHIPLVLFQEFVSETSNNLVLHKDIVFDALERKKVDANPEISSQSNLIKVNYSLVNEPKVSIIIPTKDNKNFLFKCIQSLEYNTDYKNFEIIIIDNNSQDDKTKSYLSSLPYSVINYDAEFNFSKMNNLAASKSTGDYLLFLNDDTEALDPHWLKEMVSVCQQKDIGIVGAKLLYNNSTIQHAGMIFLKTGYFFHPFQKKSSNSNYFFGFINTLREMSSVTGACLLIKRNLFEEVGKFGTIFDVYYGDSDLCFKVRKHGFKVIYNPHAILRHDGSSKIREIAKIYIPVENHYDFNKNWPNIKNGDPYYNPNLSLNYDINYTLE